MKLLKFFRNQPATLLRFNSTFQQVDLTNITRLIGRNRSNNFIHAYTSSVDLHCQVLLHLFQTLRPRGDSKNTSKNYRALPNHDTSRSFSRGIKKRKSTEITSAAPSFLLEKHGVEITRGRRAGEKRRAAISLHRMILLINRVISLLRGGRRRG